MTYQEQLKQPEWDIKRREILKRDNYQCTLCLKKRSNFTSLIKSFGILPLDEIHKNGYSLDNDDLKELTYNNIRFRKENWIQPVTYIGNPERELVIEDLRFAMKYSSAPHPDFGKVIGYSLIAFYLEELEKQGVLDLNVHHKKYILGNKAWEYNNDYLISLCVDCHKEVHNSSSMYTYNFLGERLFINDICTKCNGSGYINEYNYFHNGVCFECWGSGVINN